MSTANTAAVDVFPITTSAFGFPADWYARYSTRLLEPSYLLMILMLVLSIGIWALKRFEDADFERKLWNIPILILSVTFWPVLVLGIKMVVDSFNTFLIQDVFQIRWAGFGFPSLDSALDIAGWSAESLARLLPNLAYWIIYAFFIVLFFLYAALGPLLLTKGLLFDEVEGLLDLVHEIAVLFLWQTTVVILVAFIMPEIVSGNPLPPNVSDNFYFLSVILGVMLLFVPTLTRKFASQVSSGPSPHGVRLRNLVLGMTAASWAGGRTMAAAGFHPPQKLRSGFHELRHWGLMPIEVAQRRRAHRRLEQLRSENRKLSEELETVTSHADEEHEHEENESLVELLHKAKKESQEGDTWA